MPTLQLGEKREGRTRRSAPAQAKACGYKIFLSAFFFFLKKKKKKKHRRDACATKNDGGRRPPYERYIKVTIS